MEFDDQLVLPYETEFFSDLFEYGPTKDSMSPAPALQMGQARIEISPVCIIGLDAIETPDGEYVGGGRRYLWVRARPDLVEFLATQLRVRESGSVHFRVKIRQGRALIVAVQGNDPGEPHWLAVVRSDSIPQDEDLSLKEQHE